MRGKRVRALRNEFIEKNGRVPNKAERDTKGKVIKDDEFRKIKKNYVRGIREEIR